jgi:hypothetical protein
MTPKDAITILENTSKLCNDIGTKGLANDLLEVIKVINNLVYDAKVKADHRAKVQVNTWERVALLEKEINTLKEELANPKAL